MVTCVIWLIEKEKKPVLKAIFCKSKNLFSHLNLFHDMHDIHPLHRFTRATLLRVDVGFLTESVSLGAEVSHYLWIIADESAEILNGDVRGLWHLPLVYRLGFAKLEWGYFAFFLGNCRLISKSWLRSLVGSWVLGFKDESHIKKKKLVFPRHADNYFHGNMIVIEVEAHLKRENIILSQNERCANIVVEFETFSGHSYMFPAPLWCSCGRLTF